MDLADYEVTLVFEVSMGDYSLKQVTDPQKYKFIDQNANTLCLHQSETCFAQLAFSTATEDLMYKLTVTDVHFDSSIIVPLSNEPVGVFAFNRDKALLQQSHKLKIIDLNTGTIE